MEAETNKKTIFPVDIASEMKDSYLQYSMSVIVGRALPDVRDGLKPVHRRILFAMKDLGNTFDKPYKKSARVVGDVIGKYHPHGEAAAYDAIVRMAQDFSMNHILIDGQGNFGSVDGDTAAASRYTEIRMTELSGELLKDLEKETVSFEFNYDDTLLMPKVLPARFPHLLVNGSAGIAVGMASNIPPHNLGEVTTALIELLDRDLSISEIFNIIPGPDFPTAGSIIGQGGVLKAYHTGRGSLTLQAQAEIEETGDRNQIIVTELPYQTNKSHLIESMAQLVRDKKITGISDIRDESSREGMRIVILLKRKENAKVVLNNLYKQTRLKASFGVHLLALDREGLPKTFSIKDILEAFLAHRRDVVTRRLVFDLTKSQERMHILEGLMKALDHLDEAIALIRASKEASEAKKGLMNKFELSALQSQAILDLRLQKLTGLEREKIKEEWQALKKTIEDLKAALADPQKINDIIKKELEEIKEQFSKPRQTRIETLETDFQDKDLIAKEDIIVQITTQSGIKRILIDEYRLQKRGGIGLKGSALSPEGGEWIWKTLCVNTHTTLLVLTSKGRLFHLEAFEIPAGSRISKSRSIKNFLPFQDGEQVRSVVAAADFKDSNQYLCMISERGLFKKTALSSFARRWQKGINALGIREKDLLSSAVIASNEENILVITQKGMGIRFKNSDVRGVASRTAYGVRGIQLRSNDRVIGVHSFLNEEDVQLLTVSQGGYGKLTPLNTIRTVRRGGIGVKLHKLTERVGESLAGALLAKSDSQVLVMTNKGQNIRISCEDISKQGRFSQGVRLIRLKEGETVTGISLIDEADAPNEKI